jgi:hypothetical protein
VQADLVVRAALEPPSRRKHFSVSLAGPPTKPLTRAVSWLVKVKHVIDLQNQIMKLFANLLFLMGLAACSTASVEITPTEVPTIVPTPLSLATYRDTVNKFEVTYSKNDYLLDSYNYPGETVAFLLNVEDLFAGKNLEEVRIAILVNPECRSYTDGYSPSTGVDSISINGISFTKYSERDGTHSYAFDLATYQTMYNENRYEIFSKITEQRLEAFPNLTEYSRPLLETQVNNFIESFRFIE